MVAAPAARTPRARRAKRETPAPARSDLRADCLSPTAVDRESAGLRGAEHDDGGRLTVPGLRVDLHRSGPSLKVREAVQCRGELRGVEPAGLLHPGSKEVQGVVRVRAP